jgi:hypothetical protein
LSNESYNEEEHGDYGNGDRESRIDVAAKTIQARASNGDRPAKSEVKNGAPAARLRQPPTRTAFFTY